MHKHTLPRGATIDQKIHWNKYSSSASVISSTIGYVLDCFPSAEVGWKSYEDQAQFLQDLELKPDFIINLKVCDYIIVQYHLMDCNEVYYSQNRKAKVAL